MSEQPIRNNPTELADGTEAFLRMGREDLLPYEKVHDTKLETHKTPETAPREHELIGRQAAWTTYYRKEEMALAA